MLKIIKEDILRILGQEENKKVSLESIKSEIKVSNLLIIRAVEKLEKKGLIRQEKGFLKLTKSGQEKARSIVEKHLILENYFRETRSKKEAHKTAHILEHYVSGEVVKIIKKLSIYKGKGVPLTEFDLYQESLITDIVVSSSKIFERIVSMGIFPGNKIRLTNKIPNGIVVKIKNKKFALDKDIAKKIMVLKHEMS